MAEVSQSRGVFRFIATDDSGLPLKRKKSQKACAQCRRSKRRCRHVENGTDSSATPQGRAGARHGQGTVATDPSTYARGSTSRAGIRDGNSTILRDHTASSSDGRRIRDSDTIIVDGDANLVDTGMPTPVNVAEEAGEANEHDEEGEGDEDEDEDLEEGEEEEEEMHFVGHSNPQGIFLANSIPASVGSKADPKVGFWITRDAFQGTRESASTPSGLSGSPFAKDHFASRVMLPYLEDQCSKTVPEEADFRALNKIYQADIHPIIPLVNFKAITNASADSMSRTVLQQAICLAASMQSAAEPYLKLRSAPGICMEPQEFRDAIASAMLAAVNLGFCTEKLVVVQALGALALFTQLSHDNHSSAEYTARAVSHVQTIGLHLDTSTNRKDHATVTRIFCVVWAIDILNALFHGRPVLLHERDFGRDMQLTIDQQKPLFRLFLKVVALLGSTIAMYRPGSAALSQATEAVTTFENLLTEAGATRSPGPLVATIEMLYHTLAILHDSAEGLKEPNRSPASCSKESLAISKIVSICDWWFAGQLSALPLVPYALISALKATYRNLRNSKAPYFRTRARSQILRICDLLKQYTSTFASAAVMCDLAERIIREMDKTVDSLISTDTQQPNRRASVLPSGSQSLEASNQLPQNEYPDQVPVDSIPTFATMETEFDGDYLTSADIFEHFDPSFDLSSIDAIFSINV